MTAIVDEEDVEPGKRLFARDEPPEFIFFVREGRLRLVREGRPAWLFEGRTVIGVFDALLDRPHMRTAIADTRLHLLKLRVDRWLELLEDSFGLARGAIANSVATVAALEARRWATQTMPATRGPSVILRVPPVGGPLAFVERLATLAEAPLVRGAGIQVLVELADVIEEVSFEPGESIYVRGQPRGQTFFVLEGEVLADRKDPDIEVPFGPGSIVGGVAALGEPILAWQSHAVTRVRALSMRHDDWFDLMEEHFDLVRSALSALALLRESILDELEAKNDEVRVG
ncbi:MAG TPA: cyclic nucleotide-binding domain-containing protein, partial [Polyangiaceae bacterium]|jgi:CRP-like cAMP-binding protein|nr:cyclic nucleotide-binding domain-containing protein [Polyangiaceae bacterium]